MSARGFDSWQLEQLEEPEQDLMDKSGLRTASSELLAGSQQQRR